MNYSTWHPLLGVTSHFGALFLFQEWDEKAREAKTQYEIAMKEYKESGGGASASSPSKT